MLCLGIVPVLKNYPWGATGLLLLLAFFGDFGYRTQRHVELEAWRHLPAPRMRFKTPTLPETTMKTQKGPYKEYSPSKRGLYGFPC